MWQPPTWRGGVHFLCLSLGLAMWFALANGTLGNATKQRLEKYLCVGVDFSHCLQRTLLCEKREPASWKMIKQVKRQCFSNARKRMIPDNAFKPQTTSDDYMMITTVVIKYSQSQPYVMFCSRGCMCIISFNIQNSSMKYMFLMIPLNK